MHSTKIFPRFQRTENGWLTRATNRGGRKFISPHFRAEERSGRFRITLAARQSGRRDGKELFFLDAADTITAVDVNTSEGAPRLGAPHALFQAVGIQRDFGPFDVTADGKKFLVNSGNLKEGSDPLTLVVNWPAELKK